MIKFYILLILSAGFHSISFSQQKIHFTSEDLLARRIPDSLTTSSENIAKYIISNCLTEKSKVRTIYIWITENIQYDIDNRYSFEQDTAGIINKTLETRKGVCTNFAKLFNDIAIRSGVKSYVITGYTKDNGIVDYNPHAWCSAMIDSCWYIFDPTWGSGSFQNLNYIKKRNDDFYRMRPEKSIQSHMPFDPLWQFINYPITNIQFCNTKTNYKQGETFFNYGDTLKIYVKQTNIERLIAIRNRIEKNSVNNILVYFINQQLKENIKNYYYNAVVEKYNLAMNTYKEGIYLLNRFLDYRNNHFTPYKEDSCIKLMLDSVENSFNLSKEYLGTITNPSQETQASMNYLLKSIESTLIKLNEQKYFVEKYINTDTGYREKLFYD